MQILDFPANKIPMTINKKLKIQLFLLGTLVAILPPISKASPGRGLISNWRLNAETVNCDSYEIQDRMGNRNGSAINTFNTAESTSLIAPNSYLDFGDEMLNIVDSSFSVSFWFKTDAMVGVFQNLLSFGNHSSYAPGFSASLNRSQLIVRGLQNGLSGINRLGMHFDGISLAEWHHLTLVFDYELGVLTAYLDGQTSGATPGAVSNNWKISGGGGVTNAINTIANTAFGSASTSLFLGANPGGQGYGTPAANNPAPSAREFKEFAIWERALSENEVLDVYSRGVANEQIPGDPALSASYSMEGNGDNGSNNISTAPALELSGYSYVNSLWGQALHLDGATNDSTMSAEDASFIADSNDFSISLLCRPSDKTDYQIILAQASVDVNKRLWWIGYSPANKRLDFLVREADNQFQSQVFSNRVVNKDEWVLVVASCSNGRISLSVTPLDAEHPSTTIPSDSIIENRKGMSSLTLGGRELESTQMFLGEIDELAFWKRKLTVPEIDGLFLHYKNGKDLESGISIKQMGKASQLEAQYVEVFDPAPTESHTYTADINLDSQNKEYVLPYQLASGDFELEFEIYSTDVDNSKIYIDLGADRFLFDGTSSTLLSEGNEGSNAFLHRPLSYFFDNDITDNNNFTFKLASINSVFKIWLNDNLIYDYKLGRDTYGEVAIGVESGEATIDEISILGSLLWQSHSTVFAAGENNTACYRLPAAIRALDGTVLVFAEARVNDSSDLGNIDMVVRRSLDSGSTWQSIQVLKGNGSSHSFNNAVPVLDENTGNIHLIFQEVIPSNWGKTQTPDPNNVNYKLWLMTSNDSGATWTTTEINKTNLPSSWHNFHPGPGHGIILKSGSYAGRIIIPGWYIIGPPNARQFASAIIYSDNNGTTWHGGGTGMTGGDESMVTELGNGDLLMTIRPPMGMPESDYRHVAVSHDGGETFDPYYVDYELRATVCQSSVLFDDSINKLYFTYPASGSFAENAATRRAGLSIRHQVNVNSNQIWSAPLMIYAGRSAYSDMIKFPDNSIGVVFEAGRESYLDGIRFTQIDMSNE
ncbi:exo-alpha-sialidase [Coraliomargarita sp. SDUM461004]|uniref:exo-alpha-sialidase n=1 Tax=Thalassobacterium sedimentorum TaxID=3041258 RepID=A0ABU1AMW7_9BACT|nr:sialidase family protein [Coraliomargarita sp. SDUM461004]MDQ8196141.1 exo-alpha-sialidase [Coraliomargarita sp. SDUM461004]